MALNGNVNSYTDYAYTGGVQSVTAPVNGIYKLECWGAGSYGSNGAKGGYSVGYKRLTAGDKLYVVVGGKGTNTTTGGYNGGGGTNSIGNTDGKCSSGGGATHIATRGYTLRTLADTTYLLLVAGGAGGGTNGYIYDGTLAERAGGAGGGTSGVNGTNYSAVSVEGYGAGGTQSEGYGFGYGGSGNKASSSGGAGAGGAGGGLRGGYGGYFNSYNGETCGAGGGSGYIGGCPTITYNGQSYAAKTTTGGGSDVGEHGKARVTLVATTDLPVFFNGSTVTAVYFNGTKLDHLIYGGKTIFMRAARRCREWLWKYTGIRSAFHRATRAL